MTTQMRFQKTLCLLTLIMSAITIVYAFAFFTGGLATVADIYDFRNDRYNAAGVFNYGQQVNDVILILGIVLLCLVAVMYITACNKRRNYYMTNYIAIGDDVYMYTGVTSVTSDQSNIGFILSNQRTKETRFYSVSGATEASARASAESQVQQMRYTTTFPLLLNIADQPTYFMSLKGADGLVKMFAMVNVQQYNIVETGGTVAECEANYRQALADNGLISDGEAEAVPSDQDETAGVIAEIRSAVLDGNSYYFLRLEGEDAFYAVSAAENPLAVILNVGDRVTVTYTAGEGGSILTGASVAREGTPDVAFTPEETTPPPAAEAEQPAENASAGPAA